MAGIIKKVLTTQDLLELAKQLGCRTFEVPNRLTRMDADKYIRMVSECEADRAYVGSTLSSIDYAEEGKKGRVGAYGRSE